jgi:hypothetical protein
MPYVFTTCHRINEGGKYMPNAKAFHANLSDFLFPDDEVHEILVSKLIN